MASHLPPLLVKPTKTFELFKTENSIDLGWAEVEPSGAPKRKSDFAVGPAARGLGIHMANPLVSAQRS
jgi:hypothetical protein